MGIQGEFVMSYDEITKAELIAIFALVVSVVSVVISAGSFSLEFRRWFESGVKLKLTYSIDRIHVVHGESILEPDKRYISVDVSNRGDAPTTLTHLTFIYHPTIWDEWRYDFSRSFIRRIVPYSNLWKSLDSKRSVNFLYYGLNPANPQPHFLEPGARWSETCLQNEDIDKMLNDGRLWLRIYANHADKPIKIRLRRRKKLEGKEFRD